MKKNQIVLIVFLVFVLPLSFISEVFPLDKTGSDLISNYKEALKTRDPDVIRAAYEALKTNKQAVKHMQKNQPRLYQRFNQRAVIDEMNLAHQQQAARGEIKEFKDIEGSKFGTKKKMPTNRAVSGDPDLAELAKPGQKAVSGPKGDPDLAKLAKGKGGAQPSSGSPKTKYTGNTKLSGDAGKTRLSGSGADTKYTGDTKLAGDPGKTGVSGQPKQNIGSKAGKSSGSKPRGRSRSISRGAGNQTVEFTPEQMSEMQSPSGDEFVERTTEKVNQKRAARAAAEAEAAAGKSSGSKPRGRSRSISRGAGNQTVEFTPEQMSEMQSPSGDEFVERTTEKVNQKRAARAAAEAEAAAGKSSGSKPRGRSRSISRGAGNQTVEFTPEQMSEMQSPSGDEFVERTTEKVNQKRAARAAAEAEAAAGKSSGSKPRGRSRSISRGAGNQTVEFTPEQMSEMQSPSGDEFVERTTEKVNQKRAARAAAEAEAAAGKSSGSKPRGRSRSISRGAGNQTVEFTPGDITQTGPRTNISGKTPRSVTVEGGASSTTYVGKTKPSIKQGAGRALGAVGTAGIVSHGVQKERAAAAAEGRDFDPIRAGVQTGRSLVGGDFYDQAKQIAKEERQKEFERARAEGRDPDYVLAADKATERVRNEVLDLEAMGESMGDRIGQEEALREIERAKAAGEAPSATRANIESARRIIGEITMIQSIYDNAMYDSDADRAAADMGRRVTDRRQDAILDMDDGLHEIALIQQRLSDLDKNPIQDDPWVKQRRQELLDAYTAKRSELQRTNEALGDEAGAGDGEFIAIRGAVALIPEKPDYRRNEGEQIEEVADAIFRDPGMEGETEDVADAIFRDPKEEIDDLARAMVDNQVTAEEQAQWQDQGAADPNSLAGEAIRGFTRSNPAGYTDTERTRQASVRVTRTPDKVKKKDIEKEMRKAEEQERQAEEQKANQQRLDEAQFTNDWSSTIRGINDSLSDLNEQDAQKVKDMTEAAIILIQQMQNGTLSDEDFTRQMSELENEHANLQREGLEGWRRIRDRLIGDQVNPGDGRADIQIGRDEADPCVNNFTMTNNSELRCKCQGYTFDNSRARCVKTGGGARTASAGGTGSAASTANSGGGGAATVRKGMMYRIHTPPYGGGDVCLTAEEAEGVRNAPNTVLFEPLGQRCTK